MVDDLGRAVIGAQRDKFPDLRAMQVDVEVVSGSGQVMPFLQAVDNGMRAVMIRAN